MSIIIFISILCASIWSWPVQAVKQNVIFVNVTMDVTEDLKGLHSCFKGAINIHRRQNIQGTVNNNLTNAYQFSVV